MAYQKIINLLDNIPNQPSKFRTKNWVKVNANSHGTCSTNSQIKFKTSMLRSSWYDHSDAHIFVGRTITIIGQGEDDEAKQTNERDKGVIFQNFAPFTKCINQINNTQIDDAQEMDEVMPMYNLIEYSDNYSKTSASLWQYYRDEPNASLTDPESFKFKVNITGKAPAYGNTKDVEIEVPLEYLSNFWITFEMPLINCEISLNLPWSSTCVTTSSTGKEKFAITDTKLYVLVITLSTQSNVKLLGQLKSAFEKIMNWNKYIAKKSIEKPIFRLLNWSKLSMSK